MSLELSPGVVCPNVSKEGREKLSTSEEDKIGLLQQWEDRRVLYEQCRDLQVLHRDTKQADMWMNKQESFVVNQDLRNLLDSLAAQEERIKAGERSGHITAIDGEIEANWEELMAKAAQRKQKLDESNLPHGFLADFL